MRRSFGKESFAGQLLDGNPRDVHGFLVGIILDGQFPARGPQQVVVHGLVDAVAADGEPVVDASQRRQDLAFDAGFLGDLADGGFLVAFLAFRMALRQAPFQPVRRD